MRPEMQTRLKVLDMYEKSWHVVSIAQRMLEEERNGKIRLHYDAIKKIWAWARLEPEGIAEHFKRRFDQLHRLGINDCDKMISFVCRETRPYVALCESTARKYLEQMQLKWNVPGRVRVYCGNRRVHQETSGFRHNGAAAFIDSYVRRRSCRNDGAFLSDCRYDG